MGCFRTKAQIIAAALHSRQKWRDTHTHTHFEYFCHFCLFHFVLNTKIYFQTAHRRLRGRARPGWCLGPRSQGTLDATRGSCQERRAPARAAGPSFRQARCAAAPRTRPAAGHPGGGSGATQRARAGEAAGNSTRGYSSFRNTGDSAGLAETRLFGKPPHLWEDTSWLRSLPSISLCFSKV